MACHEATSGSKPLWPRRPHPVPNSDGLGLRQVLKCLLLLAVVASLPAAGAETHATNSSGGALVRQRGDYVHDPSTIVKDHETFWFYSTGGASRHSTNLVDWQRGPRILTNPPAWTTNLVSTYRGSFWAPDVIRLGDRYLLYYSVSSWGQRTSAIGLATNATLDPESPNYRWVDCGPVFQTSPTNDFNAIDPCVTQDAGGRLWLAFGSFWSGIKLVELNPATGLRLAPDSPIHALAWHDSIEAACIARHDNLYYLFVDWDLCCRGTNSTYNIRIGRSAEITGPYLDKTGKDMLHDGGSLFLGSEGRFIGPGHAGILSDKGTNWFSFHYYDGERGGAATLGIRQLKWGEDGWPVLGAPR